MQGRKLECVAMNENHKNFSLAIGRQEELYTRRKDIKKYNDRFNKIQSYITFIINNTVN